MTNRIKICFLHNEGLEETKKEMTEVGNYFIISIDDNEMQLEDVDGIQLYKRAHEVHVTPHTIKIIIQMQDGPFSLLHPREANK